MIKIPDHFRVTKKLEVWHGARSLGKKKETIRKQPGSSTPKTLVDIYLYVYLHKHTTQAKVISNTECKFTRSVQTVAHGHLYKVSTN